MVHHWDTPEREDDHPDCAACGARFQLGDMGVRVLIHTNECAFIRALEGDSDA